MCAGSTGDQSFGSTIIVLHQTPLIHLFVTLNCVFANSNAWKCYAVETHSFEIKLQYMLYKKTTLLCQI